MAQDYVDESNPFSRTSDEDVQKFEFGSGGRTITFQEIDGVKEGTSPAQAGIGKSGDGAPSSDQG